MSILENIKQEIVDTTGYTAILEILIDKGIMTKKEFIRKQKQVQEKFSYQIQQLLNSGMSAEEIKKLIG